MSEELTQQLEKQFVDLAKESWLIDQMFFWNDCIDEMMIGYVITSSLDKGYTLLEITNDSCQNAYSTDLNTKMDTTKSHLKSSVACHYLIFENNSDKTRLIYKLERIARDIFETKVFGQLSRITIGYGEKYNNARQVQEAIDKEFDEIYINPIEPGIITLHPDEKSGYVYAQVSMILNISRYDKYDQPGKIDLNKLDYDIASILYSLKNYLDEIMV